MTNSVAPNEAGFTLIEVLIAMTIFAVGLLATAGMQITALQSNARAHSMTTINAVAAGIMEEILTWSPDDAKLVHVNGGAAHIWDFVPTTNVIDNTLEVVGGGSYVARYFVEIVPPVATSRLSRITVEVELTGGFVSQGARTKSLIFLKKTQ